MVTTEALLDIGLVHWIALSGIIFSFGMIAVLMRKNVIVMMMGIELMLNAVNLSFIAFAKESGTLNGHVMVFFVMTIAAAEAGVGLALAVAIYKKFHEVNIRFFEHLRG
ncbi:MAG TPA: NADH-quinone oxidoreductase subunit NuoK [Bdellovibrionales bacterium]|nr:NADH-quinone oxidoreductase subunit NuoK [Bdellovibrionales bacterium]